MTSENWSDPNARSLSLYLDGADDPDRAADGTLLVDDDFLFLVNAWWEPLEFVIPPSAHGSDVVRRARHVRPYKAADAEPTIRRRYGHGRARSVALLRAPRAAS